GTSHHPETLPAEPRETLQGGCHHPVDVLDVDLSPPASSHGPQEVTVTTARPPRIGCDHAVPGRDVYLELVEEAPAVLAGRPPVDVQEQRDLLVAVLQVDPHVQAVDREVLRLSDRGHHHPEL